VTKSSLHRARTPSIDRSPEGNGELRRLCHRHPYPTASITATSTAPARHRGSELSSPILEPDTACQLLQHNTTRGHHRKLLFPHHASVIRAASPARRDAGGTRVREEPNSVGVPRVTIPVPFVVDQLHSWAGHPRTSLTNLDRHRLTSREGSPSAPIRYLPPVSPPNACARRRSQSPND